MEKVNWTSVITHPIHFFETVKLSKDQALPLVFHFVLLV